jgi:hypothetical protein
MPNREPTQDVPVTLSPLHLSQKVFWFSASACLLIGTCVFSWQVIRGRAAAVEVMGIKFTSEKAEQSIITARDTLLTVRTRLTDAAERNDLDAVSESIPQFDDVLKSLGVAEAALKRQQRLQEEGYADSYWIGTDYGVYDDKGYNYGGSRSPSAKPSPMKPPK